jgi:hypothetical protein
MTERIKIDGGRRSNAELIAEVPPAYQSLPHERFAARHVAVGLDKPTAHDMPFPLFHEPLNASEQSRIVFLNPFVQDRLVVVEYEPVIFLAQVCGYPECRHSFSGTLFPFP